MRHPAYQTFSSVIPGSTFIFVQPGVKNFGLGKASLSLKVLMKFRGLGNHVCVGGWGGDREGFPKRET